MRSFLRCRTRRCLRLLRGWRVGGALFLLTAIAGVALAGASVTVEAQEYSPYADPERPALSLVLSDEQNLEAFRAEFGLGGGKIEEVQAAIGRENEALAAAYAESEQIVQANEGLPPEEIEAKIAASGYHEKVRAAIAETKATIENLLPEGRRPDLGPWVDARITQEGQEASELAVVPSGKGSGVSCRVFATQYNGFTRSEVALPHKSLKFKGGYSVRIQRGKHATQARVKEVGPWNIRDNYWQGRKNRDMWGNLPRCTPEAQAAYFDNFNRGRDQYGRKVLNPAGIDLTPRVASKLGLKRYENAWVRVRFPWVGR